MPPRPIPTHNQPCQFTQDLKDEVHIMGIKLAAVEVTQSEFVRWQTQQNGTLGTILKAQQTGEERREAATTQRLEDARLVSDKLDHIVDARRRDTDDIKDSVGKLAIAVEATHTLIAQRDAEDQKTKAVKDDGVQKQFQDIQKQITAILVTVITMLVSALVAAYVIISNHLLG